MQRRNILKAAASLTTGAVLAAPHGGATTTTTASPFIETPDRAARLFYRDWGAGKPVVFTCSWALPSDSWYGQMLHLTRNGLRCVAYDRRGHGRSSDPGRGYDYDTLADDLAAVINHLDLHDITLVGHSMGCGEIVRYLSRHGARRVARVAFVGTITPFVRETAGNPDGVDQAVLDQVEADFRKDFPKWLGDNARPFFVPETSVQTMQWVINLALQTSLHAAIEAARTHNQTDFRPELSAIQLPALIIHGDKDVSAPWEKTGKRTARLLPASRLKLYEGAPHGLMFTHAERLNADLLAFISS